MTANPQASNAPKAIELNAGDVVDGRYRILRRLGQGGMGTVYEAQQVKLDRLVALKVLKPEYAQNEISAKRFEREARAASSIDHRNVVKILEFGDLPTGELYYTMELMQGSDLAQLLRENGGPLPWSRAGWIILQVVRAFAAIHEQNIVHRDIKPANCFMLAPKAGDEPDFVKILDFGIANLQQDEGGRVSSLTGTSDILGSVLYMAPEQVAAEPVDSRTDIYSLGIMMYELLTGDVPFRDQNAYKVMQAHLQKPPVPPREINPDIPPEVADLIMCALSKSPQDRPQAMTDIEKALVPLVVVPGTIEGKRTAPRAGTSMRFRDTYALKLRRQWLSMVVAAVALFVVTLAVTRWIKKLAEDDPDARTDYPPHARLDPSVVVVEPKPEWLLLLPEKEYDPFADPFGHASLAGLKVPDESGTLVPLESLLPPEPWTLDPGRVAGRILNDRKRPLAKGGVCAWSIDPKAPDEVRKRPYCTETDNQGRFELKEVVPGYYDINVFARGFLPKSYFADSGYPLVVLPKGSIEGIEMTLEPGGVEVRGVVKSKLGDRLEQAKVAVVGTIRTTATTNKAGEFSLWVAEGDVSIVAWAANYADAIEKGSADQEFSFNLSKQSILAGSVVDEKTNEPIQGARVRAIPKGNGLEPLVYTDSKGGFMITGLTAGEYEYSARTDDGYGPTVPKEGAYRIEHKVVKVVEGSGAQIEIKLLRSNKVAIVENEDDPPPASAEDGSTGEGTDGVLAAVLPPTIETDTGPTVEAVETDTGPTVETDAAGTVGPVTAGAVGSDSAGAVGSSSAGTVATSSAGTVGPGAAGTVATSSAGTADPGAAGTVDPATPGTVGPEPPARAGSSTGEGSATRKRVGSSKPKDKDRPRRKKLHQELQACGKGKKGKITVTATLVYSSGELKDPDVEVTGEARGDREIEACAEGHVKRFALLPRDDNEVDANFKPLVVNL